MIFPVHVDGGVRELIHEPSINPRPFRRRIVGPDHGGNRMEGMEAEDGAFQAR